MNGKIAFVSGCATGIGKASALAFAARGASLALVDLDAARGEALAEELRNTGTDAQFFGADMTQGSAIDAAFYAIGKAFGHVDYAHNNVGFSWGADLLGTDEQEFDRTLDLCLKSPFLAMRHQIRMMQQAGGGAIVNTASMAGVRYSAAANAAYSAAKAGVIHLSAWAAVHHAPDNIRVNAISPGLVSTEAVAKFMDDAQQRAFASNDQPIGRPITVDEIAASVVFLCSDDAAMITGENICIAGGAQV